MSPRSPTLTAIGLILCATAGPALGQARDAVVQITTPDDAAQTRNRATPTVTAYPAEAAGDGATTAAYAQSRWAEDWRGYADPAKRDDPLDRLKFLPLDADGDIYLTLSGELRGRVNVFTNPGLRDRPHSREDLTRIFAGADLHLGEHFRVFGELAHAGIAGRNNGIPAATLKNDLIVQQAFVEGNATLAGVAVGARYGRQEFADGSSVLVSQRDNPTIRTVLNGFRGWARGGWLRADVFDLEYTRYGSEGTGDDRIDRNRRFSGVTTGIMLPRAWLGGSKLYLEPFAWRLRTRNIVWGTTAGREEREFYGLRLWGDAGPLTLDWTVDHQAGSFANRSIDAWQVFVAQTLRLGKQGTAPRIGVHADYASGGTGGTGALNAAVSPYVNAIYYSYQGTLGPTNLKALAPNFTASPIARVRVTTEHQFTWRAETSDAVYRVNGTPFVGTQSVPGSYVGGLTRVQAVWSPAPRVSVTGRYEHLAAGEVLTGAGYRDSDYFALWLNLRF